MIKVKIGDDIHEVSIDQLELGDNQVLIDRNNPPKGFFTQKALDETVQQRLSKEQEKVRNNLRDDKKFHSEILGAYNISLDDNGNPKGLKPDFDPQDWIKNKSQEITKPLKEELENFKTKYDRAKRARIEDAILASTKGLFQDQFTKSIDDGKVKPIVVNQFRDLFDEDDNGQIVLKDADGNYAIDGSGNRITPDKYLTNSEKFGDWMIDKRQRGSGFQNGASGSGQRFTQDQIAKMSESEYERNREAIQKATAEGRID